MRRVRLSRVRNRIHLRTDYTADVWAWQEDLTAIKRIQGASFATNKWTYPLSLGVVRQLRSAFGERIVIDDALRAWGQAELRRERELGAITGMDISQTVELSRVPQVAPIMWKAMQDRPYQPVAAKFGAASGPHINGDEQGLGKCIESMAALIEAGVEGKGLIIGTRTALAVTWMAEVQRWMDDVEGDVLLQIATIRETNRGTVAATDTAQRQEIIEDFLANAESYRYAFLLCNPQMFNTSRKHRCPLDKIDGQKCGGDECRERKRHKPVLNHRFPLLHTTQWDFALADETHLYLTHSTGKKPSQVGLGLSRLSLRPLRDTPGMRIAMTGTPAKGKPLNLFGTLNWTRPDRYTSKWSWGAHYCKTKPNGYTQSGLEIINELDPAHARALDRDLSSIMIRRTSRQLHETNPDWAPPPIQFIPKWMDMEPKQAEQYESLVRNGAVELGDGSILTVNNHLSAATRAIQFATAPIAGRDKNGLLPASPGPKFDWLVEECLAGLGITGASASEYGDEKVVVISPYNIFLRYWYKQLLGMGIDAFCLTGETPDNERSVMQRRFLSAGGPRVFLLNTLAGGVSLTLDSASTAVVMNQTWVPDETEQAYKRCHRASRVDHFVKVYFPFIRETIEANITYQNEEKRANNWMLFDKRRGVEWSARNFKEAA